jgi:hypothetical protein
MLAAWSVWVAPDRNTITLQHARAIARVLGELLTLSRALTGLSKCVLKMAIWLSPKLSAPRIARGRPRSLWGVTPILTLPLKAMADRQLGFRSKSLVYITYVITAQFDINLRRPYVIASGLGLLPAFQRIVLAWALLRYDVFNFFADRGLLDSTKRLQINFEELTAMRAAGKRLYIYAYGADVRTRQATLALGRWNFCVDCTEPSKYCTCQDHEAQNYIAEIAKFATALVSLGDMLTYMPTAKHVNYWPIDCNRIALAPVDKNEGPLRIGHAPNHTHFKGSRYLEKIIERLKSRGYNIEYFKIQGVPNTQVLSLFAVCDVVADQFIGGAYGYTALEGMALGKPVLSYVRSADLLDAPDECPIINTTPDNLEEVLVWILDNRARLNLIGEQGRRYVQRWHSVGAVASRLGKLYRETGDFPAAVLKRIEQQREMEISHRNSVQEATGWQHPFQVGRDLIAARTETV